MKICIIWESFGAYHYARLRQVNQETNLIAIQIAEVDTTYHWNTDGLGKDLSIVSLVGHITNDKSDILKNLISALDEVSPDVVFVPGWSARYALEAFRWARRAGVPAVLMSDSNYFDVNRNPISETIKKAIVAHAGSGLAAGTAAKNYLQKLGMAESKVFVGYDVVDNQYFQRCLAPRADQPQRFLCVARLIKRKNVDGLIQAYSHYVKKSESNHSVWPLTIVGDGPERGYLTELVHKLDLSDLVEFAGTIDYDEIRDAYKNASVLILPSHSEQWGLVVNEAMASGLAVLVSQNAGCSIDLVEFGVNGYSFDPYDSIALGGYLEYFANNPDTVSIMGENSQRIVSNWGLELFANSARGAAVASLLEPARPNFVERRVLDFIMFARR